MRWRSVLVKSLMNRSLRPLNWTAKYELLGDNNMNTGNKAIYSQAL